MLILQALKQCGKEEELEEYMEREVAYIFPIVNGDNMPCLVIELAE